MAKLSKRHKDILAALRELGGVATLGEISEKTKLSVNGLSQSMGPIGEHVKLQFLGGKGRDQKFKIIE